MSITHIVATDNIGLSVINESSKMLFDIPSTHKNDKNKILKLCINQIIKKFNPSKPYFFCDNDNIIDSSELHIDTKCDLDDETLTIQINSTENSIYKLKFVGIITEPIYYLCTSQDIFNDIYEKILSKYKNCSDGTFTFKSKEIELFTPLDQMKFKVGGGKINEIIFESNIAKMTAIHTKYKELFDAYKTIDECDDYIIELDNWYGNINVFIKPHSHLYCFKYNLLKKFLDAQLINDKDLNEINLTPYLEITTIVTPCCNKKYKKYDKLKIKEIKILYENDSIYFYIDDHVYYTLFFKKELYKNLDKYIKIINEELNIFQIIETTKKPKEKIPTTVRNALWSTYFDNTLNGICQCCKIEKISKNNFDCGHVISEKNGGKVTLNNLRPICGSCNSSMGIQNMDEFMVKYGLDQKKPDIKIKGKKLIEPSNSKDKKKSKKVESSDSDDSDDSDGSDDSDDSDDSENESVVKKTKSKKIKSDDSKDKKKSKKVKSDDSNDSDGSENEGVKKTKPKKVKSNDSKDKKKSKKVKSDDSDDSDDSKDEFICALGCGKVLKSIVTKRRHDNNYCKILKQQRIDNIESEKIKNEEFEKMKNEIKLLKTEITSNEEKYIIEIEILKNKNKKLKLENKTITTDYLNLSKLTNQTSLKFAVNSK
jgi:hypothetical protein